MTYFSVAALAIPSIVAFEEVKYKMCTKLNLKCEYLIKDITDVEPRKEYVEFKLDVNKRGDSLKVQNLEKENHLTAEQRTSINERAKVVKEYDKKISDQTHKLSVKPYPKSTTFPDAVEYIFKAKTWLLTYDALKQLRQEAVNKIEQITQEILAKCPV